MVESDASGSWSVNLSLANIPALVGQVFALQAAVGPTSTVVGFDLSNLLLLDVGK